MRLIEAWRLSILLILKLHFISCLQIQLGSDILPESDCTQIIQNIQDEVSLLHTKFTEATNHKYILPTSVQFIIPFQKCKTNGWNLTRLQESDILISGGVPAVEQDQGCGKQGLKLNLQWNGGSSALSQIQDENLSALTRFLYGVFPEHGQINHKLYPQFYQSGYQIKMTSCSDVPVTGNFTKECLIQDCYNQVETNLEATSSTLFTTDGQKFPNVTRFCDDVTHDKISPTPQNRICRSKSIIKVLEEVGNEIPPEGYISPQFHIFRQHNTDSIMFILDTGMGAENWKTFRYGLGPVFQTLNADTRISVRYSSNNNILNITDVPKDYYRDEHWKGIVFRENLGEESNLNLIDSIIHNQYQIIESGTPDIVAVLGSSQYTSETKLQQVMDFIEEHKIRIFIIAFPSVSDGNFLARLTKYGGLFTVGSGADLNEETWMLLTLQHISSQVSKSQSIMRTIRVKKENFGSPTKLNIPHTDLGTQTKFIFLFPSVVAFRLNVTTPGGQSFNSEQDPLFVTSWNSSIEMLNLTGQNTNSLNGTWTIEISLISNEAKIDWLDVIYTSSIPGRNPTIWHQNRLNPESINGTVQTSVSVFGKPFHEDDAPNYFVLPPSGVKQELMLRNDGLLYPDIDSSDQISSGYVYHFNRTGLYMLWSETRKEDDSIYVELSSSFAVSVPVNQEVDIIPPGRISDLTVVKTDLPNRKVTFGFTEPGDDNYDHGAPQLYYIHCGRGEARNVSYDLCSSIKGRIRLPTQPTNFKEITLEIESSGQEEDTIVYVGISSQDSSGNHGEISNIVEVFLPPDPTSTVSTTDIIVTETTAVPEDNDSESVYRTVMWIMVGVVFVLLFLFLFLCIGYCTIYTRKKKRNKVRLEKPDDVRMRTISANMDKPTGMDGQIKPVVQRTNTKTNGTLVARNYSMSSVSDIELRNKDKEKRKTRKKVKKQYSNSSLFSQKKIYHIPVTNELQVPRHSPQLSGGLTQPPSPRTMSPPSFSPPPPPSPGHSVPNDYVIGPSTRGYGGQGKILNVPVSRLTKSHQPSEYLTYLNNNSVPAIYSEDVEYPVHLEPGSKSHDYRRGPLPERPGSEPVKQEHGAATGPDIIQNVPKVRFEEESKKVFDGHEQYQPQHHGYHGQQDFAGHHHHVAVPGSYADAHNQQPFNYILRSQQLSENVVNNRKKNISFV